MTIAPINNSAHTNTTPDGTNEVEGQVPQIATDTSLRNTEDFKSAHMFDQLSVPNGRGDISNVFDPNISDGFEISESNSSFFSPELTPPEESGLFSNWAHLWDEIFSKDDSVNSAKNPFALT